MKIILTSILSLCLLISCGQKKSSNESEVTKQEKNSCDHLSSDTASIGESLVEPSVQKYGLHIDEENKVLISFYGAETDCEGKKIEYFGDYLTGLSVHLKTGDLFIENGDLVGNISRDNPLCAEDVCNIEFSQISETRLELRMELGDYIYTELYTLKQDVRIIEIFNPYKE